MIELITAILVTVASAAFCSLLEALIFTTSTAEIEGIKKIHPYRGKLMEKFKKDIEATSSAILALNTIINIIGAAIIGALAIKIFHEEGLFVASAITTVGILLFSEILPKNIAILHRKKLTIYFIYPIYFVRTIMTPISWFCKKTVLLFIPKSRYMPESSQEDIILLAEKSARERAISLEEKNMITNALSLNDIQVTDIMTPRTVVTGLEKSATLKEIFKLHPMIPFARLPVYDKDFDNIVGIVRRRDMVNAKENFTIAQLMHPATFIPATATVLDALRHLLKHQQQLAITVDEFGSFVGVISLEDIFEHIIGKEIFEKDDVAVDMRELALKKKAHTKKSNPLQKKNSHSLL